VLCLGLDPVFDEADTHFLAAHSDSSTQLSHLLISTQAGVTIDRWDGVTISRDA